MPKQIRMTVSDDHYELLEGYADERADSVPQFAKTLMISALAKWNSFETYGAKKDAMANKKAGVKKEPEKQIFFSLSYAEETDEARIVASASADYAKMWDMGETSYENYADLCVKLGIEPRRYETLYRERNSEDPAVSHDFKKVDFWIATGTVLAGFTPPEATDEVAAG